MDICPQDALLSNGKALLCVIIILILLVLISTSLSCCQYFQSQNIIERLSNLEHKTDIKNSSDTPFFNHDIKQDLVHYVNEKTKQKMIM